MRFEEAYEGWNQGRLTQAEAAQTLGMCERSFRRHPARAAPRGSKSVCKAQSWWRSTRSAVPIGNDGSGPPCRA